MKTMCLLFMLAARFYTSVDPEIAQLRDLYEQSATNRRSANELLKILRHANEGSAAIYLGYKGAAEMMQAKYGFNPVNKLKSFKRGKILLEEAVKRDQENIELRFLRFTIQTNLPQFLGYDQQVTEDKKFLIDKLNTLNDKKLKQNIQKYLTTYGYYAEPGKTALII